MNRFSFVLLALLLTSCGAAPTIELPTPTLTIPPTSTATPNPWEALPPLPDGVEGTIKVGEDGVVGLYDADGNVLMTVDDEGEWVEVEKITAEQTIDLAPEIVAEAQEFFGSGFEISADGSILDNEIGKNIPGTRVNVLEDGTTVLERCYEYLDNPNFCVQQPLDTVKIADGKVDMYAHTYESGEFVREKLQFDGKEPGTFVEMDAYSVQEFFAEVMADSSEDPNHQIDRADAQRKMGFALLQMVSKSDGFHITLNGMDHVNENSYTYAQNYVPVMGADGKWDIIPTAEWQVTGLSTKDPDTYADVAFGVWYGKNGGRVMALEGEYLASASNLNDYWKTHNRNDGPDRPKSE